MIQFYLLYKYIPTRDLRFLVLIGLNSLAIILAHHYTSFISTAYLLAFAGLTFGLALVLGRTARPGWGSYDSNMDFNCNYKIDIADLTTVAANVEA